MAGQWQILRSSFNKLITRYKQFGGFKLVIVYAKLGVLWPVFKAGVRCVIKRQSFKQIYPVVLKKVEPFLIERYSSMVSSSKFQGLSDFEHKHSKIIWWCWLQGIKKAPSIVNACYNSLKLSFPDRDIKVVDGDNWKEYVELPEYIIEKWEKGRIPAAMFSDLLRLQLLIKYGGIWIDSTVLCTGLYENQNDNEKYLDANLFLFQYTKQGSIPVSISNWFITACTNNEVLILLRDMLFAYWKDYDCTLDYYIFHLFFAQISKEYPEAIANMPYGQSTNSLALLHHLNENFNQRRWENLTSKVCFHKLAFRIPKEIEVNKDNYYNYILTEYGRI